MTTAEIKNHARMYAIHKLTEDMPQYDFELTKIGIKINYTEQQLYYPAIVYNETTEKYEEGWEMVEEGKGKKKTLVRKKHDNVEVMARALEIFEEHYQFWVDKLNQQQMQSQKQ